MNELLLLIILARRNNDVEGWMQILVFVALAVFWAVGGILKAKANKSRFGDKDNLPRKPSRKPPLHSREAREQMLKKLERPADSVKGQHQQPRPAAQKPRMKFADLQAAIRKFAAEAEKAFEAETKEPVQKSKPPSPPVAQIKDKKPKISAPITPAIKGLQDERDTKLAPIMTESEYLSELLIDYADPDELRKAILHYEILGKPLSLRDPSE
jgi:hypothetical protein